MYFVTICTHHRQCVLGEVVDGKVVLSISGEIASSGCFWLENRYSFLTVDIHLVLPNHTHAIICIHEIGTICRGGSRTAPTAPKSLSSLIGAYKTRTTKKIKILLNTPGEKFWQRSFYDHIIRDDQDLEDIHHYIQHNALKWKKDKDHLS
jgi:putative transposase